MSETRDKIVREFIRRTKRFRQNVVRGASMSPSDTTVTVIMLVDVFNDVLRDVADAGARYGAPAFQVQLVPAVAKPDAS